MGLRHDELVEKTLEQLKRKGYNPQPYVRYHSNGLDGEFDILAGDSYYEVKSHMTRQSEKRALEQFHRAMSAFPQKRFRFYLVTDKGIKEYSLGSFGKPYITGNR